MMSSINLAAVATAVSCSRLFVRTTLKQWNLANLTDDAELLASELVTNAVKKTGIARPSPRFTELTGLAMLQVRLVVLRQGLVVEVWDRDITAPVVGSVEEPDDIEALDESGRGLFIVQTIAKRWSFYRPEGGGKWVWAELEIPRLHGSLPQRRRTQRPNARPAEGEADLALMVRVRDGLRSL